MTYFGVFVLLLMIFLIIMGFSIQNHIMSGVGLLFFLLLIFSTSLLSQPQYSKKYLMEQKLLKNFVFTGDVSIMNGITVFIVCVSLIVLLSMYLTGSMKSGDENPFKTATYQFIFLVIFLVLFIAPFASFSYALSNTKLKSS